MKYKLLLFALCCSLFMPACKKDNKPAPAPDDNKRIKEQILGTWILYSGTVVYYDKSGKEVMSEPLSIDENESFEFSSNNKVKTKDKDGEVDYQYFINPVNGKQQIDLKDDTHDEYYDVAINENIMSFSVEKEADADEPLYSKAVSTYSLRKQ
jgi:hypothetical protein